MVLLRIEGREHADTREKLRALGFHPAASPARLSISWRCYVSESELAPVCARLAAALGDDALLDLGASFDDGASRYASPPAYWPGRFLVHVGGTRRCVLFSASSSVRDRERLFRAEREDYWANEYEPATE